MKQRFIYLFLLTTLLFTSNLVSVSAQDNTNARPVVILREYTFEATNHEKAIEILTQLQIDTLENEEGCIAFDLLLDEKRPTAIIVYEDYENQAAYKKHIAAAYYKELMLKKLPPLIQTQKVSTLYPINDTGD